MKFDLLGILAALAAVLMVLVGIMVASAHEGAPPQNDRYWLLLWWEGGRSSHAFGFFPAFEACEKEFNEAFKGVVTDKPRHVCLKLPYEAEPR